MKRMKKKVVAMVTLAMFVMTLLPMAAFAADTQVQRSVVTVVDEDGNAAPELEVTMEDGKANIDFTVELDKNDNVATKDVYVWLTKDGKYFRYANIGSDTAAWFNGTGDLEGSAKLQVPARADAKYSKSFVVDEAGSYEIHAAVALRSEANNIKSVADLTTPINVESDSITVTAADTYVDSLKVTNPNPEFITDNSGKVEFVGVPNGNNSLKVTAEAIVKYTDTDNVASSVDQKVAIDAPANFVIKNAKGDAITEATVESGNTVDFFVVPDASVNDGYYTIKLTAGEKSYDLTVQIGDESTDVKTLEVVDTDTDVYGITGSENSTTVKLDSVAKFVAKNENGQNVAGWDFANTTVKTEAEPKKSNATFALVATDDDADVYTLQIAGNKLVEGDYTVGVYLNNERSNIKLNFTVDKFGKAVDIKFGDATSDNHGDVVNDEVIAGDTISGDVLLVDENGVTKKAEDATIGVDGIAVTGQPSVDNGAYEFVVSKKTTDNETTVGSEITVTVYDNTVKKNIQKVFTVVETEDAYTLAFGSDSGKVQVSNDVKVNVVDENGKVVKTAGDGREAFGYYIVSNSNADANVYVNTAKNGNLTNGEGHLTLSSDKATTAEIVVYVQVGTKVYGNTLKYTFGKEAIPADTSVVMTLGSTEMLVNNEIVDMKDAAPFAQDNRTFVPFRALGEALDAQVDYDKDAKTVTYTLSGTKIVMTLDSKTYTVNGTEKTMDVAPFAKDNRTYVPVRFVGEALGFKVTGLQDGNGKYVAVAFTK